MTDYDSMSPQEIAELLFNGAISKSSIYNKTYRSKHKPMLVKKLKQALSIYKLMKV